MGACLTPHPAPRSAQIPPKRQRQTHLLSSIGTPYLNAAVMSHSPREVSERSRQGLPTPSAELELAKAKVVALQRLVDSKKGLETELQTGIPLLTPSTLRSAR